jgi:voltage-gated potassium channel
MKKAGADYVVSPTYIGGMRMVSEMIRPAAVTFLDMMLRDREHVLRVEEFPVEKGSPLIGKTVGETKIGEKTGALLVALRKGETKDYDFNPAPEVKIKENDVLVFIAGPEMIEKLANIARED